MKNKLRTLDLIKDFNKKKILVIGDSIVDEYNYSSPMGLSLETPTIKVKHNETKYFYGGASNVVNNLLELGSKVSFITLLGDDDYAKVYDKFKHRNLHFIPVYEKGRKTTVKRRFWCDNYKLLQIDHIDENKITKKTKKEIKNKLNYQIDNHDIILIVDYNHSMLNKSLIKEIKSYTKKNNISTLASSQISNKKSNHKNYSGVDLVCMNLNEAKNVYGNFNNNNSSELEKILKANICITLGKNGALLRTGGKDYIHNGFKVNEAEDSCGAGDSFLAAFSLCDYKKNPNEALKLGNLWASLAVTNNGITSPKKDSLIRYVEKCF